MIWRAAAVLTYLMGLLGVAVMAMLVPAPWLPFCILLAGASLLYVVSALWHAGDAPRWWEP